MDQATLKKYLNYNPDTGVFTRKLSGPRVKAGKIAGTPDGQGYLAFGVAKGSYKAHRVAWLYVYGVWPDKQIDHINGDRSDNRICNLRLATNTQNQRNAKRRKDNKSGYKGVHWCSTSEKWVASIRVNWKGKTLGRFDNKEDAHRAYCEAANAYYGEFSRPKG